MEHSKKFDKVKYYYDNNLWTLDMVRNAVDKWITEEEYNDAKSQEMVFKDGIAPEDKMAQCLNEACGYRGIVSTLNVSEDGSVYSCPDCGEQIPVGNDASQAVYSWYMDTVYEDVAKAAREHDVPLCEVYKHIQL